MLCVVNGRQFSALVWVKVVDLVWLYYLFLKPKQLYYFHLYKKSLLFKKLQKLSLLTEKKSKKSKLYKDWICESFKLTRKFKQYTILYGIQSEYSPFPTCPFPYPLSRGNPDLLLCIFTKVGSYFCFLQLFLFNNRSLTAAHISEDWSISFFVYLHPTPLYKLLI